MQVNKLEFVFPDNINPMGRITLDVDLPVLKTDLPGDIQESEGADIELSEQTVDLLRQLKHSIIKDIYANTK